MGGRGAASGISVGKGGKPGNPYGSQYHTLFQNENIKFVKKNTRQSETLMETRTPGRVYVEVGGNKLLRIVFFDEENRRNHVIERDKRTDKWHAHDGYLHIEKSASAHNPLSAADKIILAKVQTLWYNYEQGIV